MELFQKLFGELLLFVYHCFDRIVINGYLSGLSRPEQVVHFFRQVIGVPILSKEVIAQRTNDYQNWVEAFAANHQIPIQWGEKGVRKEDYVLPWLRRMRKKGTYGVYFIFKTNAPQCPQRLLRILYPYHPCFGQTFEVFGSAGGLRDLVYVRMPNNATRGIPAWMFDEAICASIRCADHPMIDCQALLKLAQLLDLQVESRGIGRHESSFAQSKIASKAPSSPDDTDAGEVASKRSNTKRRSK